MSAPLARNSFVFIAVFASLAFGASLVDSPWRDGPLLDITPEPPPAFRADESAPRVATTSVTTVSLELPATRHSPEDEGSEATRAFVDPRLVALATRIDQLADSLGAPAMAIERPCLDVADGSATTSSREQALDSDNCDRRALDAFFDQLTQVALQQADRPARASVFGDSLVMGDGFCGELRRLLGAQFGDGGHGFVFMANPERQLGAEDIVLQLSDAWNSQAVVYGGRSDRLYGLAGAAFTHDGDGTWGARLPQTGPGARVERLGYLLHVRVPDAAARLSFDDQSDIVSLGIPDDSSAIAWFDVPEGTRRIRLGSLPRDAIHYGVFLENRSGVVVDNLGLVSSRMERLLRINEAQFAHHLQLRGADLNLFFYGANSAPPERSARAEQEHRDEYAGVLERTRTAVPHADCLVMSLLTRGQWVEGAIVPYGSIPGIVTVQREAALEAGCAFFDVWSTIGGNEGAELWYSARPQLLGSDLAHPTRAGYRELAALFYVALIDAYAEYLDRRIAAETR